MKRTASALVVLCFCLMLGVAACTDAEFQAFLNSLGNIGNTNGNDNQNVNDNANSNDNTNDNSNTNGNDNGNTNENGNSNDNVNG